MRKNILTLILAFTFITSYAADKDIIAEVVFENFTEKELSSGAFLIIGTNERIEISNTESFNVKLSGKGKYQFSFLTDEFAAYTYYPARITNKKNTITIRLEEKKQQDVEREYIAIPQSQNVNLTHQQIEQKISEGNLNFIIHGIDNSIPKGFDDFKEKYGIGVVKENCVIDPLSFKRATESNQMIYDYLNDKFGKDWLSELPFKPFGIK
ncbi:hypothetical protein [Marivirga sp.]|uniref:FEKKY domain-containing protein n=1 Tax=Marivirga sp. TaxID=2018662 RepID=UPI002D7FCB25|nr:hypothetical protein [Marivirga sp.]HET8858888.1 hypothetical protein [Marivirga sp.]